MWTNPNFDESKRSTAKICRVTAQNREGLNVQKLLDSPSFLALHVDKNPVVARNKCRSEKLKF